MKSFLLSSETSAVYSELGSAESCAFWEKMFDIWARRVGECKAATRCEHARVQLRWPESHFQTPTRLLYKHFWIRIWFWNLFKFERLTLMYCVHEGSREKNGESCDCTLPARKVPKVRIAQNAERLPFSVRVLFDWKLEYVLESTEATFRFWMLRSVLWIFWLYQYFPNLITPFLATWL